MEKLTPQKFKAFLKKNNIHEKSIQKLEGAGLFSKLTNILTKYTPEISKVATSLGNLGINEASKRLKGGSMEKQSKKESKKESKKAKRKINPKLLFRAKYVGNLMKKGMTMKQASDSFKEKYPNYFSK
jgi:hypothetical protein